MLDVVCLGEALIDLVPTVSGIGLAAAETFVKAAGGAPANVAVALARLGRSAAFTGTVGNDGFGRFLERTLAEEGVDISSVRFTDAAPTALAAVSLHADGEHEFVFYGHPAAHALFAETDLDEAQLRRAKILHHGSISLIGSPSREATLKAVTIVREAGGQVSYDPNLRLKLWPDENAARAGLLLGLAGASIVKISEEEVAFLTGASAGGARSLWHPRMRLMAVTRGAAGCTWLTTSSRGEMRGFEVAAVDTTGAGDAFMGALLAAIAATPATLENSAALEHAVRFANAAGALATMRRGAIPALPDRAAVERLIAGA